MAETELKKQNEIANDELAYREDREKASVSHEERLKELLDSPDNACDFKFLNGLVKGVDNLDPKKRAQRNIFKSENTFQSERRRISNELSMWIDILSQDKDRTELVDYCKDEVDLANDDLSSNLSKIRDAVRQMEVSYRTLNSFFDNAVSSDDDVVRHLSLINVNKERLNDSTSDDVKDVVQELEVNYDKIDLRHCYSLMVIPGYVGSADSVRFWGKMALKNKVLLVTDFLDYDNYDDLYYSLRKESLQDSDLQLARVVMTANYVLARRKSEMAEEDTDLFIPSSAAIAGRMSDVNSVMISQGVAGVKYGALSNVLGTRFDMRKSEVSLLIDNGVVPVVEENGKTMAFSNQSLYKGDRFGLQEYPVARVFDWVGKVIQNYCNGRAFNHWSFTERNEIQQALLNFLNECKACRIFEKYNLKEVRQDPVTFNIIIQLEILPNLAAKNFLIELTGQREEKFMNWEQNV